jgi:hypothetical protein
MKKRRRIHETYEDPSVYKDILLIIARHCTVESFARLKWVCKRFHGWLPEEHPGVEVVRAGYAADPPVCYPGSVVLVFEAYYRRFLKYFPNSWHPNIVESQCF